MATTHRPSASKPRHRSMAPGTGKGDFDAPTPAERRRMDKEQSAPYRESYEAGQKQGREEGRRKPAGGRSSAPRPSASKRAGGRRRPVPGARSTRSAVRQLQAPVREQVTSGIRIVGVSLALVALYNILVPPGPEAFTGVLRGASRALTWLSAPTPFPTKR